jgi:thioredoxin:protein disulfide reductase
VFVVLALAMFDVLHIDFSRWSSGLRLGQRGRGTFLLAFAMGGIVALLAGACVAPVVLQVILVASKQYAEGSTVALALPFLLGIGMAAPWPFAGAGLAALPKPGAWMVRVKQAFGVIILATAAYYGYLGYGLLSTDAATSQTTGRTDGWYPTLAEGIAAAQREGKPVLVDMWATWCKNCTVMDETTFKEPNVIAAMDGYVRVKFQAEDPEAEPARTLMERFDTVGLPTYVILHPR